MKTKLKIGIIITLVFVLAATLFSCKKKEEAPGQHDNNATIDENVIYSPSVNTVLILGDGVSDKQLQTIKSAYWESTGKNLTISTSSSSPASHEIIVGKTDREISQKAYRLLSILDESDETVGYVFYSDGTSVAIAYDEPSFGVDIAFSEALDRFVTDYMNSATLKLNSGIVAKESFDPVERQKTKDAAYVNRLWGIKHAQLSEKFGEAFATEVITELESLRLIYKEENIVSWLANLYDPVTGGFYYSNSARNNVGYLPDLESTAQAIGIVQSVLYGYGGTLTDYFGEEISAKFVKFAKGMQASDNGYFYHPQWNRELTDKNLARRQRDLLNAISIIDSFGALPTYDTPNGVKGDGIIAVSSLTTPISHSKVLAVSKLIAQEEDDIYIPPHLATKADFTNYLNSLKMGSNTRTVAEELASYTSLILIRDEMLEEMGESYRLSDILLNWLGSKQNYKTGLWDSGNSITYDKVSNLYSVVKIYNDLGKCIPNASTVLNTLSEFVNFTQELDDISNISNTWAALSVCVNNVRAFEPNNYGLLSVYNNLPQMLQATREKLTLFVKTDGSFSAVVGGSTGQSYGMSIAIPSSDEGDINSTLLAVKNTWLSIFNSLGIASIPVFNTADRMMLQKVLLDMGVIIKNEIVSAKPVDFNDEIVGDPTTSAKLTLNNASKAVVSEYSKDRGNVLHILSSYNDWEYIDFGVQQKTAGATCNAFELDLCVQESTSEGYFAQLRLHTDMYMIGLYRKGDTIKLIEETSLSASMSFSQNLGVSAKVGEWFNLRVEYYAGQRETVRIKVYFNGECVAVTDNFYGSYKLEDNSVQPGKNHTAFRIAKTPKNLTMDFLIDNVISEQNYKTYVPETDTSGAIRRNVDAPDAKQKVYDFESSLIGSVPEGFVLSGTNISSVGVEKSSNGGKYLSFGSGGAKLILPLHQRGGSANSALVRFNLTVDESSAVGAKYEINFNQYCVNQDLVSLQFIVAEEGGNKHLTFAEALSGKMGNVYDGVRLPLGEPLSISLHYFFNEGCMLVFANNELVGINSTTLNGSRRLYMGEVVMSNLSSNVASEFKIDNLVCERVKADFATASAPAIDRVIYRFDTLDGIESSGVSSLDGAISFSGASNGAYIKIPVNKRGIAATLGYISLDIEKISSEGEIIIYLTDYAGNNVAAFTISSTESGIAIYEYTSNGRYKSPICEVNKTSFTLVIEYSSIKECFNFFDGEKYLAATSVSYRLDSHKYNFEALRIGVNRSAGFKVDNVVAEMDIGVFIKKTTSATNPDNTAEVLTYEKSSFVSIPNRYGPEFGSVISALRVKEGVIKGEVSRVLEFASDKGGSDALILKTPTNFDGFNAVAYESDMMLLTEGAKNEVSITFRSTSNNAAGMFYLRVNPGEYMTVASGISGEFSVKTDVKDGEWFKLRVEYACTEEYDYNYDEIANDIILRIYINDTLVATGKKPYTSTTYNESVIGNVRFIVGSGVGGRIYFDNTVFEQCKITYEPPFPADTHTLTYEPGVISKAVKSTLGKKSSLSISDMMVEGQVSKVLKFLSANGNEDKLNISVTQELEGANAISFETDIMILPTSDTMRFFLEPLNASNKQPFRLTITAEASGNVILSGAGIADTVIGNCGEWIHLKVEYMNPELDYTEDGKRDILCKVYIGNSASPIATGYTAYSATSYYDPVKLTVYRFTVDSMSSGEIYLDNTKFWQINLSPDAGGVAPDNDSDAPLGGGSDVFDQGGWD